MESTIKPMPRMRANPNSGARRFFFNPQDEDCSSSSRPARASDFYKTKEDTPGPRTTKKVRKVKVKKLKPTDKIEKSKEKTAPEKGKDKVKEEKLVFLPRPVGKPKPKVEPRKTIGTEQKKVALKESPRELSYTNYLKQVAMTPLRDTERQTELRTDGEVLVEHPRSFDKHYILVSKELFETLGSLAKVLKSLRKQTKKVPQADGFIKIIRSYPFSIDARKLVQKAQKLCSSLGVSVSFYGYESFISTVVARVPELKFVEKDNIFKIQYNNSFNLGRNNIKVLESDVLDNAGELINFNSNIKSMINNFYYNNKINFARKRLVELDKKFQLQRQKQKEEFMRIKLTSSIKKVTFTKFDFKEEDFPNLYKDKSMKLKMANKLRKQFFVIPRIVITQPPEDNIVIPIPTAPKQEMMARKRTETIYKILAEYGDCIFCSVKVCPKRLPRHNIRKVIKEHPKCTCIQVASQQGDDGPTPDTGAISKEGAVALKEVSKQSSTSIIGASLKRLKDGAQSLNSLSHMVNNVVKEGSINPRLQQDLGALMTEVGELLNVQITHAATITSGTAKDVAEAVQGSADKVGEASKQVQLMSEFMSHDAKSTIDQVQKLLDSPFFKKVSDSDFNNLVKGNLLGDLDKETLIKASESVTKLSESITVASENLSVLTNNPKEVASKLFSVGTETILSVLGKLVGLILTIPLYFREGMSSSDKAMLFTASALMLDLPRLAYQGVVKAYDLIVDKFFKTKIEQQSEEDEDFSSLVGPISQMLTIGLVGSVAGEGGSYSALLKAGNVAKSLTSVKSLSQAVKVGLDQTKDNVFEMVTGLPSELQDVDSVVSGMSEWMDLIKATVENPKWMADYMDEPANEAALSSLVETGELIQLQLLKTEGSAAHVKAYVAKVLGTLKRMLHALVSARSGSKDRPLPVSVLFYGSPGIGKTYAINQLVIDLFSKQPDTYRDRFTEMDHIKYTRSADSDYYEGYLGHFAYVQDEIFQSTLTERLDMDCKLLMNLVQESSAPLNMAAVDAKGKVNFQSKYVLFTTNRLDIHASIPAVNSGAIARRLHFKVSMGIIPQFLSNNMLNVQAWEDYAEANGIPSDVPGYALYRVERVGRASVVCNYIELVEMLHEQQQENERLFSDTNTRHQDAFRTPRNLADLKLPSARVDFGARIVYRQGEEEEVSFRKKITAKTNEIKEFLSRGNVSYIQTAKEKLAYKEGEKTGVTPLIEKYGVRDEEELVLLLYLNIAVKGDAKQYSSVMGKAFNRPWTKERLTDAEKGELSKVLDTPIVGRFRMVLRTFLAHIKRHPFYSLLAFLSLAGLTTLGIFGIVKWNQRNESKKKVFQEAKTYTEKASKGHSIPSFTSQQQGMGEVYSNGFELKYLTLDPSPSLLDADQQACSDMNWESQLTKVISNLMVVCYSDDLGISDGIVRVRGVAVDNDYAIIPVHGIRSKGGFLTITRGGFTFTVAVRDLKIMTIGDRWGYDDVALVKFPKNKLGGIRPILKLFCTQDELKTFVDGYGELIVVNKEHKVVFRHASAITTTFKPTQVKNLLLRSGFKYTASTENGDCGSPLIRWDPRSRGKILGIHVAGVPEQNQGFSCVVDRDWIEAGIEEMGMPVCFEQGDEGVLTTLCPDQVSQMDIVGYTEQRARLPLGPSMYIPSEFLDRNFGVPKTAPARRTALGPDSTLAKVLAKFPKKAAFIDSAKVKSITSMIYTRYFLGNGSKNILTYEEALNALESVRSVDLSTSMGFPWSIKQLKKDQFVEYDEENQRFVFKSDEILNRCFENERMIEIGKGRDFVFINSLKDERLPLASVEKGKVRMFMICPFDLTLMVRKFYGSFINYIHSIRLEIGVCIGIDPHMDEWNFLAQRLLEKNERVLEVDYSNWDRSIMVEFLGVFFDLADQYYSDGCAIYRKYIRASILNPTYQLKYFRYKVLAGNPSGCPVTAELNSIANLALTLYVISESGFSLLDVFNSTYIATYGDDSLISSSLDFDVEEVKAILSNLGMLATGARKDQPVLLKPLCDAQFLKRSFLFFDGKYYAPLIMDTIMESLLWVKRGNNQHFNFTQTINNALEELKQYPPRDVSEQYYKILSFGRRCGFAVEMSEHCLVSLFADAYQEGNCMENFMIKVGLYIYNKFFRMEKRPLCLKDTPEQQEAVWVAFDISDRVPYITKGVYYHTGIRVMFEGKEQEITYSDQGCVYIDPTYVPEIQHRFTLHRETLRKFISPEPYHIVRYNCISWCEDILREEGELENLPHYVQHLWRDLAEKTMKDSSFLWAERQSDDLTETNNDVSTIQFLNPQQMDSSAEARSLSQILGTFSLLHTVGWDSNNTYNHLVKSVDFPKKLHAVKQFECKMKFTELLRADVSIRIEVAQLRLFSGTLVIYWIPCANEGLPKGMDITAKQATGMQHAILRLPDEPVVEMVIPYNHFKNYISQTRKEENELGTLNIKVLNSLSPPDDGTASVTVKILAAYTNVQAIITTPLSAESTWGKGDKVYPRFLSQQGDEDVEKTEQGLITTVATKVARAADIISGIPVFSGVASTVSVVSRSVATVADYLGLSKPRSLASTIPVKLDVFANVGYSDALDNSRILGMNPRNSVVIQPSLFGSLEDQMSINYLIRKPSVVLIKDWSTEHGVGKTLIRIPVHPLVASPHKDDDYDKAVAQMSYLGYVASCFKYWRGTIRFEFEVVCTAFHSGSFMVGFIPRGTVDGDKAFDFETTLKQVVEVTGYVRTSIEIPFISTGMVNKVGSPFDIIDLTDDVATGTLVLKVDKPLVSSGVVSKKVKINIRVSAGEDFSLFFPYLGNLGNSTYTGYDETEEQGDFGLQPTVKTRIDLVMGEEVYSIRQLLKISSLKYQARRIFSHHLSSILFPAHTFTGTVDHEEAYDNFYTHFMRLYRFSRGGVRHKVMFSSMNMKVSAIATTTPGREYTWVHSRSLEGAPWTTTHAKVTPYLEYEIPFYSNYKLEVHGSGVSDRGATVQFERLQAKGMESRILLYESIGDDFSAGYMMGPPLLYQKQTSIVRLLKAIKSTTLLPSTTYVDDSYDYRYIKEVEVSFKSSGIWNKKKIVHQQYYYLSELFKYTMLVADADFAPTFTTFFKLSSNPGESVSKAICFIRRDDVDMTTSEYKYDAADCPLNGAWIGVTSADDVQFYFGKLSNIRNMKKTSLKSDPICELLCPQNLFRGKVTVPF